MAVITLGINESELRGTDGDDVLVFSDGVTSVNGGMGFDIIDLSFVTAPIEVDLIADTIVTFGNINGISAVDVEGVIGGTNNDQIYGDDGDNLLDGFMGDDYLDGRGGVDTLSFASFGMVYVAENPNNAVIGYDLVVDMYAGTATSLFSGNDTFVNFQNVEGSGFSDHIIGDDYDNVLYGLESMDRLEGGWGDDTLHGGNGNDYLYGTNDEYGLIQQVNNGGGHVATDNDTIYGGSGYDYIVGGDGDDWIDGGEDDDTIFGDFDVFGGMIGTTYDDVIYGGAGQDLLVGGEGEDEVHGGDGYDQMYGDFSGPFAVGQEGANGPALLQEGSYNDLMMGGLGGDIMSGGMGDDILHGEDGDDQMFGSSAFFRLARGEAAEGSDDITFMVMEISDDDQLFGGEGNDLLVGGEGDDMLDGGTGDDTIFGDFGIFFGPIFASAGVNAEGGSSVNMEDLTYDDIITGGDGEDYIVGGIGNDDIDGGNDDDTIYGDFAPEFMGGMMPIPAQEGGPLFEEGMNFNDVIDAGDGNDFVDGGMGDDDIDGEAGDDILIGSYGSDLIMGSDGDDVLFGGTGSVYSVLPSFSGDGEYTRSVMAGNNSIATALDVTSELSLDYDPDVMNSTIWGHVTVSGVGEDDVQYYAITVTGASTLTFDIDYAGGGGIDAENINTDPYIDFDSWLELYDANGTLLGFNDDSDIYMGGGGSSSFLDSFLQVNVYAPGTYYIAVGSFYDLSPIPANGDYELQISVAALEDDDYSDDVLIGGAGADHLSGGMGWDTSDYSGATSGVWADLMGVVAGTGDAAGDTFNSIEVLIGTDYVDRLYGDNENNDLQGGGGNDVLFGRGGDDMLSGGDGNDFLIAGLGNDVIMGGAGDDKLHGNHGDDLFIGDEGADEIDGGDGEDTVDFSSAGGGVSADLLGGVVNTGLAAGDSYTSIENLVGTTFDDGLYGDHNDNTLEGLAGDDDLYGRNGNDELYGGDGNDWVVGGNGDDVLNGGSGDDLLAGQAGNDIFEFDMGHGSDRIIGFTQGEDLIEFTDSSIDFASLTIQQIGAHVFITSTAGTIQVSNTSAGDFDAGDFIFNPAPTQESLEDGDIGALI